MTWGHPLALVALMAQPFPLSLVLPAESSWQDEQAGPHWPDALLASVGAGVGIKTLIASFESFA